MTDFAELLLVCSSCGKTRDYGSIMSDGPTLEDIGYSLDLLSGQIKHLQGSVTGLEGSVRSLERSVTRLEASMDAMSTHLRYAPCKAERRFEDGLRKIERRLEDGC